MIYHPYSIVVETPAASPNVIADLTAIKAQIYIDHTDEDDQLNIYSAAAKSILENMIGYSLDDDTYNVKFTKPWCLNDHDEFWLPVYSFASCSINGSNISADTQNGRSYFVLGENLPEDLEERFSISVVTQWNFSGKHSDLRVAFLSLVSEMFFGRQVGVSQALMNMLSKSVAARYKRETYYAY